MRSSSKDETSDSYVEPTADPPKQSVEDRVAALEAYVAFIRPKLVALIGAEPPPAPAEEQP